MHKHKLTGADQKLETVTEAETLTGDQAQLDCRRSRLSTVVEAELSTMTCSDLAEPPPEWAEQSSEKVKVVGEKVKVPPKSYKDVEFNL